MAKTDLHLACRHCAAPFVIPARRAGYRAKDVVKKGGLLCSRACRDALKRLARAMCPCGKPASFARGEFCSRACSGVARRTVSPTLTCERCGVEFPVKPHRLAVARFCSNSCGISARIKHGPKTPKVMAACVRCGASVKSRKNRYCSRACQGVARRVEQPKWTHPARVAERRAYFRAWNEKNRAHATAKAREWAQKNEEKRREMRRTWRERHPERVQEITARRYGAMAPRLPSGTWAGIKAAADFTCLACQRREPEIKLTLDHVVPLSRGGKHCVENIQPLCGPCNSSKNARTIDYRKMRDPTPAGREATA